ncbi:MAG: 5'/3'-nucleotidase SurE [Candidatus Neomarinimicrobiota bacterium]
MAEPLILITNDDGIYSSGILALQQAAAALGKTVVVAPETERSAVGHAITISSPIRIREVDRRNGFSGFAVDGTPADCVKLGVRSLLPRLPDVVMSGINRGANVGVSILYSGTVSAATEGVLMGIPSLAVSLDAWEDPVYDFAARFASRLLKLILEKGIPPGVSLNVNVPHVPEEGIKGIRLTRQGRSYYEEDFELRADPRQRTYYWMNGRHVSPEKDPVLDDVAIRENYVSVTPLHYNLTHEDSIEYFKSWGLSEDGVD